MVVKKKTKVEEQVPEEVVEEAAEEVAEESGADLFDRETAEASSLADLAGTGGGSYEGDLLTMEAIKDRKHIVIDFKFLPSTFREGGTYACIQIKLGGVLKVINSTAMVILKGLAQVDKTRLPIENAFVKRMGKGGKEYWDFAGSDELKDLK